MDLLMTSQVDSDGVPSLWDFELVAGLSIPLHGTPELNQRATIAAYIQKGTIPGLEETGVNWTGFMLGEINPRELDAEVRDNMYIFTGSTVFIPYYFIQNGKLQLSIQEAQNGD